MCAIKAGDRLRVLWPATKRGRISLPECWYEGTCLDVQEILDGKTSKQIYQVKFDDGQLSWVPTALDERLERIGPTQHSAQTLAAMDVYDDSWQVLQLRCALSHERLTDPAKGVQCNHLPCCNYDHLMRHQAQAACPGQGRQAGACPVPGCQGTFPRSRDVRRDDALCDALASVPASAERVWLRRGMHGVVVRLAPPTADSASQGGPISSGVSASTPIDIEAIAHVPPPSEVRVKQEEEEQEQEQEQEGEEEEPGPSQARKRARKHGVTHKERVQGMTAAEAMAQARAEGLILERSDRNQTGFTNVILDSKNMTNPYRARFGRDYKSVWLGSYATAEEAAIIVARHREEKKEEDDGDGADDSDDDDGCGGRYEDDDEDMQEQLMTAAQAIAQARAEGLTLERSDRSQTGFTNVHVDSQNKRNPYRAGCRRDGKQAYLGSYPTAEEAALVVARAKAEQQPPVEANESEDEEEAEEDEDDEEDMQDPSMTAAQAIAQARAEGLSLERSDRSQTGFTNVHIDPKNKRNPYRACLTRDGRLVQIGSCATAEEAALQVARAQAKSSGRSVSCRKCGGRKSATATPCKKPCDDGRLPDDGAAGGDEADEHDVILVDDELPGEEAEGVRLHLASESWTGYKGVYPAGPRFAAYIWRGGKNMRLGTFDTAVEAAIAYARAASARDDAQRSGEGQETEGNEKIQAEAQSLRLHLSSKSSTGYKGVVNDHNRFRAQIQHGGPYAHLGYFDTAVEAAIAYARAVNARAAGLGGQAAEADDEIDAAMDEEELSDDHGMPDEDLISSRTRRRQEEEDMPVELSVEEQLSAARRELAAERTARQQLEAQLGASQSEVASLKRRLAAME